MGLAEILRLLIASSQTGILKIRDGDFEARVDIYTGQILHAATGDYRGLDALYFICGHRNADFEFHTGLEQTDASLADFPAEDLLGSIEKTLLTFDSIESSKPEPDDTPKFAKDKVHEGIEADPEELQLLLLADGSTTLTAIAERGKMELDHVREVFARFVVSGLVDLPSRNSSEPEATPPKDSGEKSETSSPQPAANTSPLPGENRPARYWRGRKIS